MKIKSTCGQLPPNVPTELAFGVAVAQSLTEAIGTNVGQYIGYKETLCQITDKRPGELHLVSWGWVPEAECTTGIERDPVLPEMSDNKPNPLHEVILNTSKPADPPKVMLTEEAIETHLKLIDAITGEQRKAALELLNIVHENFPLEDVMPSDFGGSHSLTIHRQTGKLVLGLWCNGHCYSIAFD